MRVLLVAGGAADGKLHAEDLEILCRVRRQKLLCCLMPEAQDRTGRLAQDPGFGSALAVEQIADVDAKRLADEAQRGDACLRQSALELTEKAFREAGRIGELTQRHASSRAGLAQSSA